MIVAVDAGNTRVKAMLVDAGRVLPLFAIPTNSLLRDPGAFGRRLATCRTLDGGVEGAALSSVVPALDRRLATALGRVARRGVLAVQHGLRFPFRLRVARPEGVGADRLCAAAGALGARRSSALVIDVGSAMTVDLVAEGEFRGGLIVAGPSLGLWALGRYARRLPRIGFEELESFAVGRFDDTRPAMLLGAVTAARGALLEGVRLLRRSCRKEPKVFITGGGAGVLLPLLPARWEHDPDLVAKGLFRIWVLNGPQRSSIRQKRA